MDTNNITFKATFDVTGPVDEAHAIAHLRAAAVGLTNTNEGTYASFRQEFAGLTKANLDRVGDYVAGDIELLRDGESNELPDIANSLACNLRVLAGALDEWAAGRREFVGGKDPVQVVCEVTE